MKLCKLKSLTQFEPSYVRRWSACGLVTTTLASWSSLTPTFDVKSVTKAVVEFVNWSVFVVVFPLSDTSCNVAAMLDKRPPSPRNEVAVTFPPTNTLLVTLRPVTSPSKIMVSEVMFPFKAIWCKLLAMLDKRPPSPIKLDAVTFPPTNTLLVTLRPITPPSKIMVSEVMFPFKAIWCKLLAMLDKSPPSPIKLDAATFPPTNTLLVTLSPITSPSKIMVSEVMFPFKAICSRLLAMLDKRPPSPMNESAVTSPYTCTLIEFDVSGINSESSGELNV